MAATNHICRLSPPLPQPPSLPTPPPLFSSHSLILRTPSPNSHPQLTITMNASHNLEQLRTIATTTLSSPATLSRDPNLDAIFKQKRVVRSRVRKELKAMDPVLRSHEDTAIQDIILESSWFRSSRRLCAYISCTALREVDTSNILSEILCDGKEDDDSAHIKKKLYVPRVEDKNSHMRMFNISSTDDMVANSMGILEPTDVDPNGNQREDVMKASEPVDLLLLPGLAFDKSGRRLGRAGGYYDTFLRKYKELCDERKWKLPLLGKHLLEYCVQILEDGVIPVTDWDVNVDALVTSTGVIAISPAAKERI
ncbi:5-formyltetrahydrofolate cyclo-ligase [Ranunculus cassubicifolius]